MMQKRHSISLLVSALPITVNSFLFWNNNNNNLQQATDPVNFSKSPARVNSLEIGSGDEEETIESDESFELILDDFEHSNQVRSSRGSFQYNMCENRCSIEKCKYDNERRNYWCDTYKH